MSIYDFRVMCERAIPLWVPIAIAATAMIAYWLIGRRERRRRPDVDYFLASNTATYESIAKQMDKARKSVKP